MRCMLRQRQRVRSSPVSQSHGRLAGMRLSGGCCSSRRLHPKYARSGTRRLQAAWCSRAWHATGVAASWGMWLGGQHGDYGAVVVWAASALHLQFHPATALIHRKRSRSAYVGMATFGPLLWRGPGKLPRDACMHRALANVTQIVIRAWRRRARPG